MTTDTVPQEHAVGDSENIICGCMSLSLADLRARLAKNPNMVFEDLTSQTGAGTKCTACLLDLEFYFVEAQSKGPSRPAHFKDDMEVTIADNDLKQRLYGWLDRVSPLAPYHFNNSVPVLYGNGVEQGLWITNRSMLFEGEQCAPSMRMDFIVRDHQGRFVKRVRENVAPESSFRYRISEALQESMPPAKAGEVGIGSVEIRRQGMSAGIRGTTRPQIEIVTPNAACAVHSQAMTGAGRNWFACLYRPGQERMFFSLLNGVNRDMAIEMSYPIGVPGVEPVTHRIQLPPRGATLHELKLPEDIAAKVGDMPISITWTAPAPHKVHAICATPALDRFSIDHL